MGFVERVIEGSLRQRVLVLVGVVILVGLGVWSVLRIPIDAFPDVTNIQVEVLSTSPGMSPPEVERFVTYPVETAMRGLPRLDQVRSVSKAGLSVVTVVFEDGVDIYFARQLVLERLIEARERVPAGTEIAMGPVSTAMGEVYQYTLVGPRPAGMDETEYLTRARTVQDWILAPLLKSVQGVNEINSFGGYIKQYHVTVDPEKLLAYDLTLRDVGEALRRNNLNVGGNILERGEQQYLVRGIGLLQSVDDIGAVALKTDKGTPVLVRDVAEVRSGQAVRQGGAVKDGRGEVVGGVAMMLRGANGRDVVRAIENRVVEINRSGVLPMGLRIESYYRRSDIINGAIHTVTEALLIGSVLVVLILLLFLRSFRGAFIVVLALPLSTLFTFVMMRVVGLSANLMSLGGLAISIGMIIDATIIQVENVQRHLSENGSRGGAKLATVLTAVLEVRKPSIFGELIIALTFIPIIALQGIEGKMFLPLAFTHIIALFASLLLSLAAIPAFCHFVLRSQGDKTSFLVEGAKKIYLPVLRWGLRRKVVVVAAAAVLLAGAAALIPRLGTEFMPIMDEGALDTDIQFLPGISLAESLEMGRKVEERLMKFPEIVTIIGKTGQTGVALEARGVEKTGYVGVLKPRSEWTSARTREELTDRFRAAMEDFPGMAFSFSQPIACRIDELVAGTRAQLIIKLFGEDLDILKAKADEIGAALGRIRGATDLNVERVAGQPYVTVRPDRARIARLGLNVEDVQAVVEAAVGGKTVTEIYEGDRYFDLQIRYPESRRNSVETIGAILLRTPGGARIPLSQVADIAMIEGPSQISRESGQRRIGVECNITGRDLGGFVAEARRAIGREVALPPGYFLSWGGQFENQQRAMQRLGVIMPVTIGLILLLLFLTFGSFRISLLVLLDLPFALIGGVLALYVSGLYLSVPASVGFIALFGIAVLNGIVLLSYITQIQEEGCPTSEAIVRGCLNRLRPVLMTATITILSLTPLLFAHGPGSEIQRPLAVVVVGGLISSTLLTLLVLPVLYSWVGCAKRNAGD